MASDLKLKLQNEVTISEWIYAAQGALNRLLNAKFNLQINTNSLKNLIENDENFAFTINLDEFPEDIVEVTFYYQARIPGWESPEEEGWWLFVTIRSSMNAPLKYLLAASLVISISEIQGIANINDENKIWIPIENASPKQFFNFLKCQMSHQHLNSAITEFKTKLNMERQKHKSSDDF